MTITERLMIPGSWSLSLNESTPTSVLDVLTPSTAAFGHVIVTPVHVDSHSVSGATLLSLARYTGIYRARPSHFELGGPGLAAWLGDEDGKGDVVSSYTANQSFVAWVTAINYAAFTAGTYTAIAGPGNLNHTLTDISRRDSLDFVCEFYGAEWRVTPAGVLDAGPVANLFATTPTAVVQPWSGGRDLNITGIRATLDLSRDFDDYTTHVRLNGATTTGTATISPATTYRDLLGNLVIWKRIIDSPDTIAAHVNAVAQAQLNLYSDPRREVTLSTDAYDIGQDFDVGDEIYVYDPLQGLVDTANSVSYRGETIHPVKIRCLGRTWPVQQGMGVYFRAPDSAGTVTDLTDWIAWESGSTSIEVGALPRRSR